VSGLPPGGVVHQWGLFPSSDLRARVLLVALGCPSGWDVRPLPWLELGALWDVPILVSDSISEESDILILWGFCASAPAKVLFAGADALLTMLFQGGSGSSVSLINSEVVRPSPRSNKDLGLVVSPLETRQDKGRRFSTRVIKGDAQKADGAAVPDHLWIHAFLEGYAKEGEEGDTIQHLKALSLPDHAAVGHLGQTDPPNQGIGWEVALRGFRTLGLARWRRQLLRGFHEWRKINVRVNRGCTPGQMIRCTIGMRGNEGCTAFAWSKKGQAAYRAQWLFIRSMSDGLAMVWAGHDALGRSANASWFKWLEGLAPFFWNGGAQYQRGLQDGQPHYFTGPFPSFMQPQKGHKDPAKHKLMQAKVVQVRKRGYILPGKVVEGTHYFCVDKGADDIRMVYNGMSCGLNNVLWAPCFGLPTVKQTLRALLPGYCQCDLDVGEQFLNYPLHSDLRKFSGVDVRGVRLLDQWDNDWEANRGPEPWERWERNWMGLRDSPYCSLQWQVCLKFEVYGDRKVLSNPFHWDRVKFNLPGSKGYRSDLPWVMKIRADGHLAAEIFVYVDDGRPTGHSPRLTWAAERAYAAGCSRRGVQDVSRKRFLLTEMPGPWASTVTHTQGGRVLGIVSQEKWDKPKLLIAELLEMIPKGPLPLQHLLEIRRFLMYMVRTYMWLNLYIKGLHLTVDSWHPGRVEDGFKWTAKERRRMQFHGMEEGGLPCRREFKDDEVLGMMHNTGAVEESAPEMGVPVERYFCNLACLQDLTSSAKPPKQLCQAKRQSAFFVIGDASGKAKGNVVVEQYGVDYESGAWNLEWREKSFNCREAKNLTDRLEWLVADGGLQNHKVFLITDNLAFEGAFYKGYSPSRELSDIVFRVHKAQRDRAFVLHVIHISGKWMKASGVDGLSREDLTEGMMAGLDSLLFIPFNQGADDRLGGRVSRWVRSWWETKRGTDFRRFPLRTITKDNMFELQDLKAARLWMMPPAAMEVVLELLRDCLAHPQWPHVIVVPRLMTHLWRKDLMKNTDLLFTVLAQVPFWTSGRFEPLIVVVILPLSHVPSYTGPHS
jgi:hypothetical protein